MKKRWKVEIFEDKICRETKNYDQSKSVQKKCFDPLEKNEYSILSLIVTTLASHLPCYKYLDSSRQT